MLINKLNNDCNPKILNKVKETNSVLKSAKKLLDVRKDVIDFFEKGTVPYKGNVSKTRKKESEDESEEESEEEAEE